MPAAPLENCGKAFGVVGPQRGWFPGNFEEEGESDEALAKALQDEELAEATGSRPEHTANYRRTLARYR